jgi:hypothetical protein
MYYILSNITSGGSAKYVADLVARYKIVHLRDKRELGVVQKTDVLLVNQLYNTNVRVGDLLHLNYIICVHDFCWFTQNAANIHIFCPRQTFNRGYLTCHSVDPVLQDFFLKAALIIYPSFFCQSQYSRFFSGKTCVQPHNDLVLGSLVQIHRQVDGVLRIGSLNEFTEMKGAQFMKWLAENVKSYKNYQIHYHFSRYSETNWEEHVAGLHGLLHLNKYGETYSYTLTKSLKSGLPLLYNNIGSYRERVPKNPHYIVCAETESDVHDVGLLLTRFHAFLDYILAENKADTAFYDQLLK